MTLGKEVILEQLTPDILKNLLAKKPTAPAVTIYLPTHRAASPPHMAEDQIRLKNLVHKAVEILKNREDGRELEATLCDRLEEFLSDKNFWENQTEGLLICARPGQFVMYHLPIDIEEYVAVDTHYHLAPIFGLLHDAQDYYVLIVAQHAPALLKGDAYGLHATNLELPPTLEEGLNIDEMWQKSIQTRNVSSTSGSQAAYHGHGGGKDVSSEERVRFFRLIDKLILDHVDRSLPLILAGTESELVEYRSASNYPRILESTIEGSFSGANPHDLLAPALDVIQKDLIEKSHRETVEQFLRLKGEDEARVARTIAAVTDAAHAGRVDTLLVGMLRYTTDTVRDNKEPVPVITFSGTEESTAAIHDIAFTVWSASGRVVNIEQSDMPDGLLAAAILRY